MEYILYSFQMCCTYFGFNKIRQSVIKSILETKVSPTQDAIISKEKFAGTYVTCFYKKTE